jgi:ABC-2 type transport system ATP-binding protein
VIEVDGLTKRFGSTLAVDGLSFSVRPGVVTGFLGPNGSGKSTTMRCILGLDRPQSGSATVNGASYVKLPAPPRSVGALLDAKQAHPGHRAKDHLRWIAAAAGVPRSRVDECLAMVGLTDVAKRRVGKFSLGMYQRLGMAAVMLGDPPVLMFDEPLNGLDPEGIAWVRSFVKALAAQGRTVFVSSHLLNEMAQTADHVVIIGKGRLIADVSVSELIAQGSGRSVRVRTPMPDKLAVALSSRHLTAVPSLDGSLTVANASAAEIGELAAAHAVVLHELVDHRASLEEAFLAITEQSVEYRGSTS